MMIQKLIAWIVLVTTTATVVIFDVQVLLGQLALGALCGLALFAITKPE